MSDNLHKSDEGWARFRERTQSGARARRAFMNHAPKAATVSKPKAPKSDRRSKVSLVYPGRRRVVIEADL